MGKNKKGLSDKVRQSKLKRKSNNTLDQVRKNPFEIKINKQKHTILGRKTKHDKGLPGVSKSKANIKRKETLLKEYKQRNKTNQIKDERFGVSDSNITLEEKMLQRFSLERKKKHEKMSHFNLNEEEDLTHLGQSLSTIEKFDDYQESDNDEESGVISGEYVSHAHFGGGIFSKKSDKDAQMDEEDETRTRKDVIDEIIAKSKQARYEKQTTKEKSEELRDKLDDTWKDFEKLIKFSKRTPWDKEMARESEKPDDYDMALKQMIFERKAAPSSKSKSDAELEAERQATLKKNEEERVARMQSNFNNSSKKNFAHLSADAIEEDFYVEPTCEDLEVDPMEEQDDIEDENKVDGINKDGIVDDDATPSDSEEEEEEEESELGDQGIVDDQEEGQPEEQDQESDDYSDIDSGNEDDVDMTSVEEENEQRANISNNEKEEVRKTSNNKFPASYSEFASHVANEESSNRDLAAQSLVAELRTKFAPGLKQGNKARMVELFAYVWEHCCRTADSPAPNLAIVSSLVRPLFELCSMNNLVCAQCIVERMKRSFQSCFRSRKSINVAWPSFAVLIQFKLMKNLFSTSDFSHPVVTPAFYFMCSLLNKCAINNISDVSRGLFVCTILFEFVSFSKRFIPDCVNYLVTVLCLALSWKANDKELPTVASVRLNKRNFQLLRLKEGKIEDDKLKPDLIALVASRCDTIVVDDTTRLRLLNVALQLTTRFLSLYTDLVSFDEISAPVTRVCRRLRAEIDQSEALVESADRLLLLIESNAGKPRKPISFGREKPKALRLINPKIEATGEPFQKKSRKMNPMKRERERLLHKKRRELKGAVREIRKDGRFIARQKRQEQEELDAERAARVKRLHGLLSNQEGDVRNIERKKYKLEI